MGSTRIVPEASRRRGVPHGLFLKLSSGGGEEGGEGGILLAGFLSHSLLSGFLLHAALSSRVVFFPQDSLLR